MNTDNKSKIIMWRLLFSSLFYFICSSIFVMNSAMAQETNGCKNVISPAFNAVWLDEQTVFVFTDIDKADLEAGVDITPLAIYQISCSGGQKQFVSELAFGGSAGRIENAFIHNVNGEPLLFVIQTVPYPSFSDIPYVSDNYFIFAFSPGGKNYLYNEKISRFFGDGGDIRDASATYTVDHATLIYTFPYKTADDIKRALAGNHYKQWRNQAQFSGYIKSDNAIKHEAPMYVHYYKTSLNNDEYIAKGTSFSVKDISANFFLIEYKDENDAMAETWVLCADTNLCN